MAMAVGWAVRNAVLVFRDRRLAGSGGCQLDGSRPVRDEAGPPTEEARFRPGLRLGPSETSWAENKRLSHRTAPDIMLLAISAHRRTGIMHRDRSDPTVLV